MPTYDYRCAGCGHRFEEFQSMTAAPLRRCPECREDRLERLIGAGAGVIFKGSGFYQTDYKGGSAGKTDKADKSADQGKPAGDAKPAAGRCTPTCGTKDAPAGCQRKPQAD